MFINVAIQEKGARGYLATAPDLAGCTLTDPDHGTAFARLRLLIEGQLADQLLAGRPLPPLRAAEAWRAEARFAGARWYELHVNLPHIEAVARHQADRTPP